MHNNLIKNINFITNLIDVTLKTNHFHLVHLVQFGPFQSTLVYLLKNENSQVWVKCIINCLSNINCNYMIIIYYHDNLLKRMRI